MYQSGRKSRYTPAEVVKILLCKSKEELTCKYHPLRVRENAAFLVDIVPYKNWEDIKDDMNGAYTKMLRCCIWTVECENMNNELDFTIIAKKAVKLMNSNQYHLIINSKGNKACPTLVRSIFMIKNASGQIVNGTAMLQYYIDSREDKVDFEVLGHGNRRNNSKTPFYPSSKSTLQAIKEQVLKKPASHVYNLFPRESEAQVRQGHQEHYHDLENRCTISSSRPAPKSTRWMIC